MVNQVNVKLGEELRVQKANIAERNAVVQNDLSHAEPALLQAQESVKLIKRTQLDELRYEWADCLAAQVLAVVAPLLSAK